MTTEGDTKPTPPAEPYPGFAADAARLERRAAAIHQAHAQPLPGPLADAFAGVPQTIAGLTVRPVVHYDFVLLQRLQSPLLDQVKAQTTTAWSDEQGYEMVYQFTRPVKEAAAVLAKGRDAFREAALEAIGYRLNPLHVALLVQAVEREFVRAFSTAVEYGPADTGPSDGTMVFTAPPPEQKTASDGGSITSAV